MNCDSSRSRLVEIARGRLSDTERSATAAHHRVCPDCSLFLEEQMALTTALTELAADTVMAPPADLELILLAEFDSTRFRSLRRRYLKPAAAMGAIAAAVACFVALHAPPQRAPLQPTVSFKETAASAPPAVMPAPKPVQKSVRRPSVPKPEDEEVPFVAIPYMVPLDPRERVTVVRVEMPVAALVAVGLATMAPDPGASAQADAVVGEDGRIHAIRLVSLYSPISNSERGVK